MRFTIGISFLLLSATYSLAAGKPESYFKKQIDHTWTVHGTSYASDSDKPPACFAHTSLADGSLVQLTVLPTVFGDKRDANPEGTKLVIRNMQWAISPKSGKRILRLNAYNGQSVVREFDAAFVTEDKNTIVVPGLSRGFIDTISKSDRMILTLRDDDASAVLTFPRSREIVKALYDCSARYELLYNG